MEYCFKKTEMDYVNSKAIVVIVGITPGNEQIKNSRKDKTKKEIKMDNAFAGRMRNPLIEMLNYIQLNKYLGIKTCESLWEKDFIKVEFTSLLKEATYEYKMVNGKREEKMFNDPSKILKVKKLNNAFEKGFMADCKKYKDAKLFIALGRVSNILKVLQDEKLIKCDIITIPHPSGPNSGRIKVFLGKSDNMRDNSYIKAFEMAKNSRRTIKRLMKEEQ